MGTVADEIPVAFGVPVSGTSRSASAAPRSGCRQSDCRRRSLIGGDQPWLLFLPAGGAGRAFDEGEDRRRIDLEQPRQPGSGGWCLSPNSLEPHLGRYLRSGPVELSWFPISLSDRHDHAPTG